VPTLQADAFQYFSVSDLMNSAMLRKLVAPITVPDDGKKQYFLQRGCQRTCPMCQRRLNTSHVSVSFFGDRSLSRKLTHALATRPRALAALRNSLRSPTLQLRPNGGVPLNTPEGLADDSVNQIRAVR
jgi:hypothetical protein